VAITGSLAELNRVLDPVDKQAQEVAQVYPLRPGDSMSV
jgi:hypothetical protein